MKTNLQFFAESRINMVSLLDIGKLMGGKTEKIVEMGYGFEEITEDWGPNVNTKQYVNMECSANTVKGYAFSMTAQRDHLSDEVQTVMNELFKKFPTGTQCETYYYRYYKTDITGASGDCIRVPVTVCPSSTGGAASDDLTSSVQINGNGDVEIGTITINAEGFSWAPKEAA